MLPASVTQAAGCASLTTVGTAITEDFNSAASFSPPSTTPQGWNFVETLTNANTSFIAGTGSGTAGDTYSFGSAAVPADRAFGGLQSGNLLPTIGACYTNNTGQTITNVQIAYTGEQ